MDYDNYLELYEAVYFFNRVNGSADNRLPKQVSKEKMEKLGINESVFTATTRILVVNKLLGLDGNYFVVSNESIEKQRYILDTIIGKKDEHYIEMFNKACDKSLFFFDSIDEAEFEVYSRYNYSITFKIGKEIVKHIDFAGKKVLELGGNSGGLGAAIVKDYKNCCYTVVDAAIPCIIGNEFNKTNNLAIAFVEGNIFDLTLASGVYDCIILMNLLHDFDDEKCIAILRNCAKYWNSNTKFLIIEDILTGEFEPKEAIMHGLRLSIMCRGGKQRTIQELMSLFLRINFKLERVAKVDTIHTMLVMGHCNG